MKRLYEKPTRRIRCVLAIFLSVLSGTLLLFPSGSGRQIPVSSTSSRAELIADTTGWLNEAITTIFKLEYEITPDSASPMSYRCPNRAQGFRTNLTPSTVTIKPKTNAPGDPGWRLGLSLQHIRFDDSALLSIGREATVTKEANTIRFHHKKDYTVEYVNNEMGLRQNFIVHRSPLKSTNTIKVSMRVDAAMTATRLNDTAIQFTSVDPHAGNAHVVYNDLRVWDATGRALQASLEVPGQSVVEIHVNATDAVFPVTIDPLVTAGFDWSVFGAAGDKLGTAVAGAGDVNNDGYSDIMIATTKYDGLFTDEGAVYIYHGSAAGLSATPATILTGGAATGQGLSNFGITLSTAGDLNGDGCSDIVIGAPDYDNGVANRGAAFIYYGSPGAGISTTGFTTLIGSNANDNFGISVSGAGDINGDRYSDIIIGVQGYDVAITNDERGAAFVYFGSATGLTTGMLPSQILQGPDLANETGTWYFNNPDLFGAVVAGAGDVNGDGYSDVLVAATQYEEGIGDNTSDDRDEGAVFVYHGSAAGLSLVPAICLEGNRDQVRFGASIGTAGDVNGDGYCDIVVSAPDFSIYPGNGGTVPQYGGAVFIFSGSANGITGAVLNAAVSGTTIYGNVPFQKIGTSVRCAGDVNGDGYADVVIGASTYDNNRTSAGAASGGVTGNTFIFYGRSGALVGFMPSTSTLLVNIQSTQTAAEFGTSVACAGDINGDGFSDILVGAGEYDHNGAINSGAVFSFNGAGNGLNPTAVTWKERNQVNSNLGISVSSAGDVNGDGLADVIVGANLWDNGGNSNCGAVFIYHGMNNGGISTASTPVAPLMGPGGSNFGTAAATAGDVNGDGYADIIVGANLGGAGGPGTAYIYHGSATGIVATPVVTLTGVNPGDNFGISVSSAGDINWDGYSDVVVGASQFESNALETNEGAAFVYYGSATGIVNTATRLEVNQAGANFGISVSHAGDVNQDGMSDIIIGADGYDNGDADEGAAFVFHGRISGVTTVPNSTLESNQANAGFGHSVAYAGDVNGDSYSDLIVGAWLYDNTQIDAGAAFVFHGSSSGIHILSATSLQGINAGDHFGVSVASSGDVNGDGYDDVIVGANFYDNGQIDEGGVFSYRGSPAGITTTPDTIMESNQAGANFGISVAGAGDLNGDGFTDAIVGANNYNGGQAGEGRFYIHLGNNKAQGALLMNRVRARNTGSSSFITAGNLNEMSFRMELLARSYLGNQAGRLIWETRGNAQPWSLGEAGVMNNSLNLTNEQADLSQLTVNGPPVLFVETAAKVTSPYWGLTRARVRIRYDLVTSLTGQVYGPWRYIDRYGAALIAAQPPQPMVLDSRVTFFKTTVDRCSVTLSWETSTDYPASSVTVESSETGFDFAELRPASEVSVSPNGRMFSTSVVQNAKRKYYRIKMMARDGRATYTPARLVETLCDRLPGTFLRAYPNPVKPGQAIVVEWKNEFVTGKQVTLSLTDMTGKKCFSKIYPVQGHGLNTYRMETGNLTRGTYLLEASGGGDVSRLVVIE